MERQDIRDAQEEYMKKIFFLALPVIVLLTITLFRAWERYHGHDVILEISGYDPVDIFAGHYLDYTVNYNIENLCASDNSRKSDSCICFASTDPVRAEYHENCSTAKCVLFLKGKCSWNRFEAGIERFYIPEEKSSELDKKLRKEGAKIRVSISPRGTGIVKDIIWK